MSARIWMLLCLPIFAGCTTEGHPKVVVRTEVIQKKIPPALLAPCPPAWSKAGGPATTGDFVERGDVNEAGIKCRDAALAGIRKWNHGLK